MKESFSHKKIVDKNRKEIKKTKIRAKEEEEK
jgi:hypothetical protein